MKNLLIFIFLVVSFSLSAGFLYPNVNVLEMDIQLSAKQKKQYFNWAREQFEYYENKDNGLAGKALALALALALCCMLSDDMTFKEYFLSKTYSVGSVANGNSL